MYSDILFAYGPHILVYAYFGVLLLPNINILKTLCDIGILTVLYNLGHRLVHLLPTEGIIGKLNLHIYMHHDKKLNVPRWLELIIEFLFEVIAHLMPFFIYFKIKGEWKFPLSITLYVILFFAFNHCVFYSILDSDKHIEHHKNVTVNFIPDYVDQIFSNPKTRVYEDMNNQIPMILWSALIVHFGKLYFQWKD